MKIEILFVEEEKIVTRFETQYVSCAADFAALLATWFSTLRGGDEADVLLEGRKVAVLSSNFPAGGYIPLVMEHSKQEYPGTPVGEEVRMEPPEKAAVEKILVAFNEAIEKVANAT